MIESRRSDDRANIFGEVCRIIHEVAEIPMPRTYAIPFNRSILKILLQNRYGPSANPDRRYSGQRLASAGFCLPFALEERVRHYVSQFLQARADG